MKRPNLFAVRRVLFCFLALVAFLPLASPVWAVEELRGFITRRGDQLYDGDAPFRFISFNIPNLIAVEDAFSFTSPHPWRWPDEFEIEDALESVRQMGGRVVRTYVLSVQRSGSEMGELVHVKGPGKFNEEAFRVLDKVVEIARRKGIRVIIPFVDQHKWWGGIGEYAAFRGKRPEEFWTDPQLIADFEATIRHLVTRKNTYTGVVYRDDPAIFGWETGNELDAPPEWTRQVAAYIKELDPNHMVIDGRSLHGVPEASLDDPSVDVITTHHYPWGDNDFAKLIRAAHAATKGKKAYFVGEFGFVETPRLAEAIEAVVDDGMSGALLWSLRFHRREGGFYWHMEVGTGGNRYKSYHWPGFASGADYDERQVMKLMRDAAFKIQGKTPPQLEPPRPPKLLPIATASEISWQGSAGASGYDIWRATERDGPWTRIAENVSDADVQYRPLFSDASGVPGKSYYYRVVARNAGGESEPSNVVGPVVVEHRSLVDECRNFEISQLVEGDVAISTEVARQRQEDCHRIALRPGSAMIYRVDGPIRAFRVYTFAADEKADLEVSISKEGRKFTTLECDRWSFPTAQSVYGYLTPVLFEGDTAGLQGSWLRIAVSSDSSTRAEPAAQPIEISRIEIEYDGKSADWTPSPLNSTVFVSSPRRLERTLDAIDAAATRGERRLNVCVTILVDLTDDLKIKSYGLRRGRDRGYEPFNGEMRTEFKESLRQVFGRIAERGMEIYILPHVDPGGEVQTWRNWIDFDPEVKYGGHSYSDLMIDTLAEALSESVTNDTRVETALSGEMGTSLFRYPQSYRRIAEQLRANPKLKQLKIGISLNHGGIAGQGNPTGVPDIELSEAQRDSLQNLIDESDFVGMSFYRPVSATPTSGDFVDGIEHFLDEFRDFGLEVPLTKHLQFSEVGIGGGHEDDDLTSDPAKAAASPWAGSGNPRTNPWADSRMQSFRRQYHRALLEFLAKQPGPRPVSAAFFWSTGSWDPIGARHPVFADQEIKIAVERHNRRVAWNRPGERRGQAGSHGDP